jgi:NADH:ubiquinone oxidoreductase subunit 4 (subunit M)
MNAVSMFRLFTRLFLGKRRTGFTVMADALPRERWILTAGVLFVVLGGLFPNAIVALGAVDAESVEHVAYVPADWQSDRSACEPLPLLPSAFTTP